jgi:hypothetical protein
MKKLVFVMKGGKVYKNLATARKVLKTSPDGAAEQ